MSQQDRPGRRPLFDDRGCLTAAGLATFARAPAGRAPAEVAAHVAACARCQDRLLAPGEGPPVVRLRPRKPRLWLGVGLAIVALVLAIAAVILASRLH